MSFNDIDDTLVAYFKQMLEEECEQQDPEVQAQGPDDSIVQEEVQAQSENDVEVTDSQAEEPEAEQEVQTDEMEMAESADEGAAAEDAVQPDEAVEAEAEEPAEEELAASEDEVPADEEVAVEDKTVEASADEAEPEVQEEVVAEPEDVAVEAESSEVEVQAEGAADEIDYAADDYVPEDTTQQSEVHELQPQLQTVEEKSEPLPFAEHKSLESLLESVPKTQVETEVAVETAVQTETEVQTETAVETVVEEQTEVEQATASEAVVADENVAQAEQEQSNDEAPYNWTNIEMPDEFQVLFFLVKGIRFAVPLVNLGGIFQCDKVTPLFGKPDWFQGIADIRGRKMNVVDTLKWVKSDAPQSDKYEYMISLDKTLWSIGCDVLEGNRILNKENITWRQTAGNRPWLAGIVKKEMCALLHVKALIKMFENGVNLKDLDAQMSA
ncbi:purine-binding chemotaxis protein CheW [Succinivibrio dextrinosolvens DSM 3072]|uniref:Purine-binding chemotaxis protein CheW n=1 Tax=Succinivibrio dextrinosolvens DSM 3072 TaxID=1123324 RepID=A0A1T4VF48_9GAMM|nr:chemotaxis protein CheW [Succinivibrio dextrinosolvens]SKA63592.1 purine-binding chemotaxis protein CheW [Succinivibrio dextrinosolvens DSM 3072]